MAYRILIVEARFYDGIADDLVRGAAQEIESNGHTFDRVAVPGVFEIPAAIKLAAESREDYAGFIALGCVIRGETDHYDHICRETSRAIMDLILSHNLALGFGVLTCETNDQAVVRAAVGQKNKGGDAAAACLRMIEVREMYGES